MANEYKGRTKAEYQREWRARNPDYQREWAKRNPDKSAEYKRRSRDKYPHKARAAARQRHTGFTPEMWDAAFVLQDGLCAICRLNAATHADHNHAAEQPRGILCGVCNSGIGFLGESIERLEAAIAYLRKWNNG